MRRKSPAQIRRSQVVTTFGPGALLDLPRHAVIVGGLEHWSGVTEEVTEDRLVAKLRRDLEIPELRLRRPPVDPDGATDASSGITAWQFPEWFVAQLEEGLGAQGRKRRLLRQQDLVDGKYFGPDKKRHPVVPVRFVQACVNGHISDLDWQVFAHGKVPPCNQALFLEERGSSGDLADLFVTCSGCSSFESLAGATRMHESPPLGWCQGRRPWLGPASSEPCGGPNGPAQPNRLLIRTASNAYFAQTVSVISIPDREGRLREAVDKVWLNHLQHLDDESDLVRERKRAVVSSALEGWSDADAWREITRRKSGVGTGTKGIRQAELEMLIAATPDTGDDVPDEEFLARSLPVQPAPESRGVSRVVLVHRLREVRAQVGFTRFEPPQPQPDGELDLAVRRADLATTVSWLPAVELKGEGVLLTLDAKAVDAWAARPAVKAREAELLAAQGIWKVRRSLPNAQFVGVRYVLLHTLSHLLVTAVSLECGYAASAIRERIYCNETGMGILLSTGTPDSEGTLGGLVKVGREMNKHLRRALALGALCSNDPHCAHHDPSDPHEERFEHGAACHGCVLIAETSCERFNAWLDRSLVIPTVTSGDAAFFPPMSA